MSEECNKSEYSQEESCSCGCGSHHHHHHHHHDETEVRCHCAEKFLEIADEAWVEVLKEKIKEKILTHKGEHMEKLATIIAKANGDKWKNKISSKTNCNDFKETLKEFLRECQ